MQSRYKFMRADPELKEEGKRINQEYLDLVGEENWSLQGLIAYKKEHASKKLLERIEWEKAHRDELC